MSRSPLTASPLFGIPEVTAGADLAALLVAAAEGAGGLADRDILVVAHKVVSKAEGRVRALADVRPGERARRLGAEQGKDPRHVQVVLDEAVELVRAGRGVLICRTRHGFVCANAGVDASNAPAPGTASRRGDHRLVRPGLASRPVGGGDRVRRAGAPG
jgi:coenzyme F420-0:L-glutamate ligase / coenzyme F420-1:gamma-L-glutamate ligase